MNSESSSDSTPLSRSLLTGALPVTDLKIHENRLRTYSNWPLNFIAPESLAQAGFYYLNVADQVKCAFCGGIIGQWETNDQPLQEHRKFFPDCPIVRQDEIQQEEIGIQSVRTAKSPEYSTLESRTRSYANWDAAVQDPNVLAQAGFFFLGTGDEVKFKEKKKNVADMKTNTLRSNLRSDVSIVTAGCGIGCKTMILGLSTLDGSQNVLTLCLSKAPRTSKMSFNVPPKVETINQ